MAASFADPKVQQVVDSHYAVVNVDIDKNHGAAAQYQVRSIPRILVFDANGEVHASHVGALSPDELATFLQNSMVHIPVPIGIHPDLALPLKAAKDAGKMLLVDFHGDWNDIWMAMDDVRGDPSVKPILDKNFYYYQLDIGHFDRHVGCVDRYKMAKIPCLIAFNDDGSPVARYESAPDAVTFKPFLQSALSKAHSAKKGLAVYSLEDLRGGTDAVGAAIAKANADGRRLIVYFYEKPTREHTDIEASIGDAGRNPIISHFALLRIEAAANANLAKRYGCAKAPYMIIFDSKGKPSTSFDKPMKSEQLVAALSK
jgi:hypothetical protein